MIIIFYVSKKYTADLLWKKKHEFLLLLLTPSIVSERARWLTVLYTFIMHHPHPPEWTSTLMMLSVEIMCVLFIYYFVQIFCVFIKPKCVRFYALPREFKYHTNQPTNHQMQTIFLHSCKFDLYTQIVNIQRKGSWPLIATIQSMWVSIIKTKHFSTSFSSRRNMWIDMDYWVLTKLFEKKKNERESLCKYCLTIHGCGMWPSLMNLYFQIEVHYN